MRQPVCEKRIKRISYLAATLLCVSGLIHVSRLGLAAAPAGIVVGFGVAYLVIGCFLFTNNRKAVYFGGVVSLCGLCIGPWILKQPSIPMVAFLGITEVAVVVSCLWLITQQRKDVRTPV
jgi:hypothetical protein